MLVLEGDLGGAVEVVHHGPNVFHGSRGQLSTELQNRRRTRFSAMRDPASVSIASSASSIRDNITGTTTMAVTR